MEGAQLQCTSSFLQTGGSVVCYKQLQSKSQDCVFVSQLCNFFYEDLVSLMSIFIKRYCLSSLLQRVLAEKLQVRAVKISSNIQVVLQSVTFIVSRRNCKEDLYLRTPKQPLLEVSPPLQPLKSKKCSSMLLSPGIAYENCIN